MKMDMCNCTVNTMNMYTSDSTDNTTVNAPIMVNDRGLISTLFLDQNNIAIFISGMIPWTFNLTAPSTSIFNLDTNLYLGINSNNIGIGVPIPQNQFVFESAGSDNYRIRLVNGPYLRIFTSPQNDIRLSADASFNTATIFIVPTSTPSNP